MCTYKLTKRQGQEFSQQHYLQSPKTIYLFILLLIDKREVVWHHHIFYCNNFHKKYFIANLQSTKWGIRNPFSWYSYRIIIDSSSLKSLTSAMILKIFCTTGHHSTRSAHLTSCDRLPLCRLQAEAKTWQHLWRACFFPVIQCTVLCYTQGNKQGKVRWKTLAEDSAGRRGRKMTAGTAGVRDGSRSHRKRCCELFTWYNDCPKVTA